MSSWDGGLVPMTTWHDQFGNLWADVPLDRLVEYADPYATPPWDDVAAGDITRAEVLAAVNARQVCATPYDPGAPGGHGVVFHLTRIAWFALHPARLAWNPGDFEAPEVDVGISTFGYRPTWIVLAGNHRYAAGLALGLPSLPFVISGCLDDAEDMFGITILRQPELRKDPDR